MEFVFRNQITTSTEFYQNYFFERKEESGLFKVILVDELGFMMKIKKHKKIRI